MIPSGRVDVEVKGLKDFTQYWYDRQNDFPDVMLKINGFQLELVSDSTGVLRCNVTMSGTKLIPKNTNDKAIHVIPQSEELSDAPTMNKSVNEESAVTAIHIVYNGFLNLHFDSDSKIFLTEAYLSTETKPDPPLVYSTVTNDELDD